jgi:hypothetical protein
MKTAPTNAATMTTMGTTMYAIRTRFFDLLVGEDVGGEGSMSRTDKEGS